MPDIADTFGNADSTFGCVSVDMVPRRRRQQGMSISQLVGAASVVCALAGSSIVVGLLAVTTPGVDPGHGDPPLCMTSGPVSGLSAAQAQNARTIVAVATPRGGVQAAGIALSVGLAESGLLALGNPTVPAADGLPVQGVGADHDSLGIFQQRDGWGSPAQRLDPVTSTNRFLDALLALPSWQDLPPWVAAQQVQRSAFDGTPRPSNHFTAQVGGNYLANHDQAATVLAVILRGSAPGNAAAGCGDSDAGTAPAGPADAHGLPIGFTLQAGTSRPASVAVAAALGQRGKPYLWGARGPDRFDCSGLTSFAWAAAGIPLGRVTTQQLTDGSPVTITSIQPGDLVLTPGSDGSLASPGHVGLYIGSGLVVNAPRTGDVVRVVTLASFTAAGLSGIRHIA